MIAIFSIYAIFAPSYHTAQASYAFSKISWTVNQRCYKKRDINKDLATNLLQETEGKVYTIYGPKGIGKPSFLKQLADDNPGVFYYEIGWGDLDPNNPFEGFWGKYSQQQIALTQYYFYLKYRVKCENCLAF